MSPFVLSLIVFVGVSALIIGVAMLFRDRSESKLESRLDVFAGGTSTKKGKQDPGQDSILTQPLDQKGFFEDLVKKLGSLSLIFEQAETTLTPTKFFMMSGLLGLAGFFCALLFRVSIFVAPFGAGFMSCLPLVWLIFRRRRRLKTFGVQLPDALELMGRALRAGHSLGAGFNLVAEEMPDPIAKEFSRVFEEQNLGLPMEEALNGLVERVPNLDLKFFATAVILQRQTGGDLAEILDKIGNLIRERFKIWGQVQALTGEGRLSGIVLLALPPVLGVVVWYLNPEYISLLFTDPLGKQMLLGAVVLQVVGAFAIRKIINIKV